MLRHTFCHLPGIGENTERSLWRAGITSWETALAPRPTSRSTLIRRLPDAHLRESLAHFEQANSSWFGRCLPAGQVWRLFHDFRTSCAYLDIETTEWLEALDAVVSHGADSTVSVVARLQISLRPGTVAGTVTASPGGSQ